MTINKHWHYKYMVIVRQTKIYLKILITNGDAIDLWELWTNRIVFVISLLIQRNIYLRKEVPLDW